MLKTVIKHWHKHRRKYFLLLLIAVVGLILWNSLILFQYLKDEERNKMELWAEAEKKIIEAPVNEDVNLPVQIVIRNKTIPVIMTDENGKILQTSNLPERIEKDTLLLLKKLKQFERENQPIEINLDKGKQYLYYGNSTLLRQLTWYPLVWILIFLLFVGIVYLYYFTSRISEQNRLWAGMAKEAAHQIGTPLSSLMGWVELMKSDPSLVPADELQRDIQRLKSISDRFAKIGSQPKLFPLDIGEEIRQTVSYFRSRLPQHIRIRYQKPEHPVSVMLNKELFQWVMENLIKNAIDAMPGGGEIKISVDETDKNVFVSVADEGKGIPKSDWHKIFEPGYSTKKRGWGLGLSVVKRIIKTYHNGHVYVKKSAPGQGTVFQIKLNKINKLKNQE